MERGKNYSGPYIKHIVRWSGVVIGLSLLVTTVQFSAKLFGSCLICTQGGLYAGMEAPLVFAAIALISFAIFITNLGSLLFARSKNVDYRWRKWLPLMIFGSLIMIVFAFVVFLKMEGHSYFY